MANVGYAYIDKFGLLKITYNENDAKIYASGKIIETSIPYGGGYPIVDVENDIHIRVDVNDKIVKVGNTIIPWNEYGNKYPEVHNLITQLL